MLKVTSFIHDKDGLFALEKNCSHTNIWTSITCTGVLIGVEHELMYLGQLLKVIKVVNVAIVRKHLYLNHLYKILTQIHWKKVVKN